MTSYKVMFEEILNEFPVHARRAAAGKFPPLRCWIRATSECKAFDPQMPVRIKCRLAIEESEEGPRLNPLHVDEILSALVALPAGRAWASGGIARGQNSKRETLYLGILWFTLRGEKIVEWRVERLPVNWCPVPVSRGPKYEVKTDPEACRSVWMVFFPERAQLAQHFKFVRQLRPIGVQFPPGKTILRIINVLPRARMALVETSRLPDMQMLLTPLNVFTVSLNVRTVSGAFKEIIGHRLPKNAVWEKVEPFLVMEALK